MPQDIIELGPTPGEEACAQVGLTTDSAHFGVLECRAYIRALTRVFGMPPAGSRFAVPASLHEFGSYYEVVYRYDRADAAQADYADKIENGLAQWAQADMWAPVLYDRRSQAAHVIEDLDRLDRDANPEARDARGVARPHEFVGV